MVQADMQQQKEEDRESQLASRESVSNQRCFKQCTTCVTGSSIAAAFITRWSTEGRAVGDNLKGCCYIKVVFVKL